LGPFAAWGRYTSANNSKYSWTAAMPALSFLAIAGLAVIAFLFVAKAAPEPSSPVMVTSQHAVVPAPNTTAQAVLIDQPKSASDAVLKSRPQRVPHGPKRHPEISGSCGSEVINRRLRSVSFLSRVIRTGAIESA
jgi:hypothetical protein